jgi:two-component system response regulator MprA
VATVLVVDDDPHIRSSLRRTLTFEGYSVREAADGISALASLADEHPEVVILDVMLPGMDGIEVCRRLRQVDDVPVLMLTARERTSDRVHGLDAGADDYLVKPFAKEELLARLRALLRRRSAGEAPTTHRVADLVLDERSYRAQRGDRVLELTPREYELLRFLITRPGQVVAHAKLQSEVWGYQDSRVLEVYVGYLRAKLEAGGEPRLLQTVRGFGYVLRPTQGD